MDKTAAIAKRISAYTGQPSPVAAEFAYELNGDGWDDDALVDEMRDVIFSDLEVNVRVVDQGIGQYEYWGSRGQDSSIGIEEVLGPDVTVTFSFSPAAGEQMAPEQMAELSAEFMANLPPVFEMREQDGLEAYVAWRPGKVDGNTAVYEFVYPANKLTV
jgi:hypothetical protein